MTDFVRCRIQKNSRERRYCDDCGNRIAVGADYAYWRGVWDGKFGVCGYCLECNKKYPMPVQPTPAMIEDRKLRAYYRECGAL